MLVNQHREYEKKIKEHGDIILKLLKEYKVGERDVHIRESLIKDITQELSRLRRAILDIICEVEK